MDSLKSSGTSSAAAATSSSRTRKDSGDQSSNCSEYLRTAASPFYLMSARIAITCSVSSAVLASDTSGARFRYSTNTLSPLYPFSRA